eukprot:g277.t1
MCIFKSSVKSLVAAIALSVIFQLLAPDCFAWTWLVYSADYLLGNPSPFRAYRDELMEKAFQSWPIPRDKSVPPQPFVEMDATVYTHKSFWELSDGYTKPLIVRGLFNNSGAIRKWTPEFLANYMGDREYVAFVNSSVGSGSKDTARTYTTTIRQVVDNVTAGGKNYIFNANLIYEKDKELAKDLELERIGWPHEPTLVQFFLGLSRPGEIPTGSALHSSFAPNVNFQLSGVKQWIMVDPKYLIYTKPQLLDKQFALLHGSDFRPIGERWKNFPRLQGYLHPGDAIYIPPYWYHEVINQPVPDWQISIAVRYWSTSATMRNQPWLAMIQDLGVRGRPCLPGTRVFFCAPLQAMTGGWTTGDIQKKSEAGAEGSSLVNKMNFGKPETDLICASQEADWAGAMH